jgi:predicted nucleic acid-binding protein
MAVPTDKLRVMVDANVLVAGTGWPRWPYALLQHAVTGDFQLVLTPYIISEARRNLQRIDPTALPDFDNFLYLSNYEEIANPSLEVVTAHQGIVRDLNDIPVAVAAITAQVDCLISSDKDLTESDELKQHVPVLLPAVFLRERMGWTSEELEAIRHRQWGDMA